MSSLVIYGNEFDRQMEGGLSPESYTYRVLVEGDSWMDRSAMFHTSLLQCLAPEMDKHQVSVLFISVAMFGDTMRRMGEKSEDFVQWMRTQFAWQFDAVLLSAGGNDFIDAARDSPPGLGILRDMAGQVNPNSAACLNANAVQDLVTRWLNPNFGTLYDIVRNGNSPDARIFLNSYDTPTARDAPAIPKTRSWLYDAYVKNNIPPAVWPSLTADIFECLQNVVNGWATGRTRIHVVPTSGTLIAAAAGSQGSSQDWLNEIHPNQKGWKKLAAIWRKCLLSNLP